MKSKTIVKLYNRIGYFVVSSEHNIGLNHVYSISKIKNYRTKSFLVHKSKIKECKLMTIVFKPYFFILRTKELIYNFIDTIKSLLKI